MESDTAVPSQYQHFIPRFILKNFSHPFQPNAKRTSAFHASQNGPRKEEKIRRGEPVVNHVDMSSETALVTETPVRRVFGHFNMYQNADLSLKEQNRVKEKLSRLESDASVIFRRILTDFNANRQGVWLTRDERNLVRKFLFVMKYRGPTFYKRYCHETIATYFAEDKEKLTTYMRERGFSRPIDVWLDNLDKFIDVQMDNEMKWIQELPERTYSPDADWLIMHCQAMYMAICTPPVSETEFLISDNCYTVSEGPHQVLVDMASGKLEPVEWMSHHEFAPISPRLLIVLRSVHFPCPEEDGVHPQVKAARETWRSIVESKFGSLSKTLLADLPVSKARNNYTKLVNGVLYGMPGQTGTLRREHRFFFKFFPIETTHVDRINGIFLENAGSCNSLVFHSEKAFRRSLEWYMTDRKYFTKRVVRTAADPQLACLKKLAALLTQLGSEKKPHWEEIPPKELTDKEKHQHNKEKCQLMLEAFLQHIPDDNPSQFMQVYQMLGGSKASLPKDMDQAALMIKLRIKIDAWSQGVDERVRQNNRDSLNDNYLEFPRRRLWLYLKYVKSMVQYHDGPHVGESAFKGPEDIIARAWRVIKPGKLNHMMSWAVDNHIFKTRPPSFDPWAQVTPDYRGAQQLVKLRTFAFSRKIEDCGIEKVEKLSAVLGAGFRHAATKEDTEAMQPFFTVDQFVEMGIRLAVQQQFKSLLKGDLEEDTLDALATVFFELLYPIIPSICGGT